MFQPRDHSWPNHNDESSGLTLSEMSLMFLALLVHIKQHFTFVPTLNLSEERLKESYVLVLCKAYKINKLCQSGLSCRVEFFVSFSILSMLAFTFRDIELLFLYHACFSLLELMHFI